MYRNYERPSTADVEKLFKQDVEVVEVIDGFRWNVVSVDGKEPRFPVEIRFSYSDGGGFHLTFDGNKLEGPFEDLKPEWFVKPGKPVDLDDGFRSVEQLAHTRGFYEMIKAGDFTDEDFHAIFDKARTLDMPESLNATDAKSVNFSDTCYKLAISYLALNNICIYEGDISNSDFLPDFLEQVAINLDTETWDICRASLLTHDEVIEIFAKAVAECAIEHAKADINYFEDEFSERAVTSLGEIIDVRDNVKEMLDKRGGDLPLQNSLKPRDVEKAAKNAAVLSSDAIQEGKPYFH